MSRLNRILLVILVILAAATAILWFEPDIISSLSALNPFSSREVTVPMTAGNLTAQLPTGSPRSASPATEPVSQTAVDSANQVIRAEEASPFEKDLQQRLGSYQTRIYTYQPYEPPVLRNPFQRIISTVYVEDEEEEKMAQELSTVEAIRRFVQPELPPETKYTGIISAGETKLAIIEMDDETYIVKEGDLILDKYLIKSISDEKVIIDINGYEITLILGGGEATNG